MVTWPSGKAKVCKTFIPRFKSGRHLQKSAIFERRLPICFFPIFWKTDIGDLYEKIGSKNTGATFKVLGLYHELLGELQRKNLYTAHFPSSVRDEKKAAKLKLVLKFIREHFADDITLEDMSAVAGLSQKYFCQFHQSLFLRPTLSHQ